MSIIAKSILGAGIAGCLTSFAICQSADSDKSFSDLQEKIASLRTKYLILEGPSFERANYISPYLGKDSTKEEFYSFLKVNISLVEEYQNTKKDFMQLKQYVLFYQEEYPKAESYLDQATKDTLKSVTETSIKEVAQITNNKQLFNKPRHYYNEHIERMKTISEYLNSKSYMSDESIVGVQSENRYVIVTRTQGKNNEEKHSVSWKKYEKMSVGEIYSEYAKSYIIDKYEEEKYRMLFSSKKPIEFSVEKYLTVINFVEKNKLSCTYSFDGQTYEIKFLEKVPASIILFDKPNEQTK